ncbi:hypothetical protein [uncultured Nostoc sp.]
MTYYGLGMPTLASSNPPEVQQYIAGFQAVNNLTDNHIKILQVHYHAPE